MKKKKLLLITNSIKSKEGGWGTVSYQFHKELKEIYNVEVLQLKLPVLNSKFRFIIDPIQNFIYYLKNKDKFKDIDIALTTSEPLFKVAAFAKLFGGNFKNVMVGYGTFIYFPFMDFPEKYFNKFMYKQVDVFAASSNYSIKRASEWNKGKIHLLPLGVDTTKYKEIKGVKREKAFLIVGLQKERKGVGYLLKALKLLVKDHPDAKLYLVGAIAPEYQALAKELGLEKNAIFTGIVSDNELMKYYSRCIAHVLPSVNMPDGFEGFGLVHLEANAAGIPSIGSKDSSNDDVIKEGVSGYLCKQRDERDLYLKMKKMIEDKKQYATMKKQVKSYAKSYSWKKSVKRLVTLIESK